MSQCDSSVKKVSSSDATCGGTQMSFKDWKMQKEVQNKPSTSFKRRRDIYKDGFSNGNVSNQLQPPPSLLNLNFEHNFFCNNLPPTPFCTNSAGNFNGNGFRFDINFNGNGFKGSNLNTGQSPPGLRYRSTGNINLSDRFFQTDGLYYQKDMLQEPNTFRYKHRPTVVSNNVSTSDRSKPRMSVNTPSKRNEKTIKVIANQEEAQKLEPTIFVRNPNRKDNKKPFIPMPKHPESESSLTTEERKQQWRDYREAMKPFKNKDFYNAKRVVQRLGKQDPSQLDEKQKFRLTNALEKMAEYKQKLAEKYDSYVKSTDKSPNELGELFVLRKGHSQPQWGSADKPKLNQYKNDGNFGESCISKESSDLRFPSGRKILGGTSNRSSFVPGGNSGSTLPKY